MQKLNIIDNENKVRDAQDKRRITMVHGPLVYKSFLAELASEWPSLPNDVRIKFTECGFEHEHFDQRSIKRFDELLVAVIDYLEKNDNILLKVAPYKSHGGKGQYKDLVIGSDQSWLSNALHVFRMNYRAGKKGMTTNANAALIALLGLGGLVRRKGVKPSSTATHAFFQPSCNIIELVFKERVRSLLRDFTPPQVDAIACEARVTVLGHLLLTESARVADPDDADPDEVIDLEVIDSTSVSTDVSVEFPVEDEDGNHQGFEWYHGVLSPTKKSWEIVVGECTYKLPVYKLHYPQDNSTTDNVVTLSKTCLLDIDDYDEPFYEYRLGKYPPTGPKPDNMPFDCEELLECNNETEMRQYVARCLQATMRSAEVKVAEEDQIEFVSEIQKMFEEVAGGLDQLRFKSRKVSTNTPGDFGVGPVEGTAIVTADEVIKILKVTTKEIHSITNNE